METHLGRSFMIAFALIIVVVALEYSPAGPVINASLMSVSASLMGK